MLNLEMLKKKSNFWAVDASRKTPMPFPGRYPTRWRVQWTSRNGKVRGDILTKPNSGVARIWQRIYQDCPGTISLSEFDRGGAIRSSHGLGCPRNACPIQRICSCLCHFYYPCAETAGNFFSLWYVPVYPLTVIAYSQTFTIYTPYEDMNYTEGARKEEYWGLLMEYKAWLKNIVWQK